MRASGSLQEDEDLCATLVDCGSSEISGQDTAIVIDEEVDGDYDEPITEMAEVDLSTQESVVMSEETVIVESFSIVSDDDEDVSEALQSAVDRLKSQGYKVIAVEITETVEGDDSPWMALSSPKLITLLIVWQGVLTLYLLLKMSSGDEEHDEEGAVSTKHKVTEKSLNHDETVPLLAQ